MHTCPIVTLKSSGNYQSWKTNFRAAVEAGERAIAIRAALAVD